MHPHAPGTECASKDRLSEPTKHSWELACCPETRLEAGRIVDTGYAEGLGLEPLPQDGNAAPERVAQEAVVLVRDRAGQPVGTLTLQSRAFARLDPPYPLELEETYWIETLGRDPEALAELRRMAVLPGHHGALLCLLAGAVSVSEAVGIRDWIGLAEAVGRSRFDALLVRHALVAQGLFGAEHTLPLAPRDASLLEEHARYASTAFAGDLKRIALPRVRTFRQVLRAHAVGIPSLHPRYPRVVLPMLAEIGRFKQRLRRHLPV